ncbi:MAG: periplasmic heavy metal sensor [Alphaproteobacteria bacterium]|nr:periplasmic heavy metal sensor [Alphaproteobacteria bacterium]
MGRAVTIALAASLAANVFLGGFVVGRVTNAPPSPPDGGHERGPRPPVAVDGSPSRLLGRSLAASETARAAFRDAFAEHREKFRDDRVESRRLREAAREALLAEPFDRAKAKAALRAVADHFQAREDQRTDFLLDVFESLSREERAKVIEAFAAMPEGDPRRRRGDRRPGFREERMRGMRRDDGDDETAGPDADSRLPVGGEDEDASVPHQL